MDLLTLSQWFIYFLFYSFIGWCIEIIWCAIENKKLTNRGFLYGPLCPIYGFGALIVFGIYHLFQLPWWINLILIIIACDVMEYLTSIVMEKIFHLRWWDYTNNTKVSLNGRISLETSVCFGLGGLVAIYLAQPELEKFVTNIPGNILVPLALTLFALYILDTIVSWFVSLKAKTVLSGGKVDRTPEIKKYAAKFFLLPRPPKGKSNRS